MKRIIYIPFDHLNRNFGALKNANPREDLIVLVESARMTTGRPWHKERLFFLISSARHFAQSLRGEGFTVEYIKAPTTIDGLTTIKKQYNLTEIICAEPSSFTQFQALTDFGALVTCCWSCNYGKSNHTFEQIGLDDPLGRIPESRK